MKQIPIMEDGVTSLNATYFNDPMRELENLIQAANIALSGADLNQAGKAVSAFVAGSDYYDCANVADAYALSAVESFQRPPVYFVGYRARFKASFTNTTAAPTVNIEGMGAVPLHVGQLSDAGTPAVGIRDILENQTYEIVYSVTDDTLTPYWRLVNGASTQVRTYYKSTDNQTLELQAKEGFTFGVRYANDTTKKATTLSKDGCGVVDTASAVYTIMNATNTGRGMSFEDGPGDDDVPDQRPAIFTTGVGSMSWTIVTGTPNYTSNTPITLADIPLDAEYYGFFLKFTDDLGKPTVCPLKCKVNNSGSDPVIDDFIVMTGNNPTQGGYTGHAIVVVYSATNIV